jgi:hypothetical protein
VAYRLLLANFKQTAMNAAATITAAATTAGLLKTTAAVKKAFDETYESILEELAAQVETDNELLAEQEGDQEKKKPARKPGGARSSTKSTNGSKTSRSSSGGRGKKFTVDEAGDIELNFGQFKGCTVAEVYDMDEEAAEEYGYDRGSGQEYIEWLAESSNNKFIKDAASAFVAGQ